MKNKTIIDILNINSITKDELIEIMGCSKSTFEAWQYGSRNPSKAVTKFLKLIKRVLKSNNDELIKGNKMKTSFNNSEEEKQELLDLILCYDTSVSWIQGANWDKDAQKRCCICDGINRDFNMKQVAEKYGVPLFLVKNIEDFFEGVDLRHSKTISDEFWSAVPVGMDDDYFKSLYHCLCIKQAQETINLLKDEKLIELLEKIILVHKNKEGTKGFAEVKKDIRDMANSYAKANTYMYSNAETYINAFANSYVSANIYVRHSTRAYANRDAYLEGYSNSNAKAYVNAFGNAFHHRYASAGTYYFTLETTIELLGMNKEQLDNLLK